MRAGADLRFSSEDSPPDARRAQRRSLLFAHGRERVREERVREGDAALARGAWAEARAIFEQELEARETVDALEGLSWAAWWVEDVPTCLEARERAYRLSRREGDTRRAAMLAVWIADDHLILRGERAIANGWFQRAARLLDGLEPCPEHGWLDALLGYVATVDGDPSRATSRSGRASWAAGSPSSRSRCSRSRSRAWRW